MSQYYHQAHYHGSEHRHHFATALAMLVSLLGGLIVSALTARFILSLLRVDRLQPLADVVYSISYPFVAPFFSVFNYQQQMGVLKFEFQTLLAILFWSFVTWFVARAIGKQPETPELLNNS